MTQKNLIQRFGRKLLARDGNWNCHYCGRETINPDNEHLYLTENGGLWWPDNKRLAQVDHCLPVSRGGTNALDNLVIACDSCNNSKGGKTREEYLIKIGGAS